MNSMTEWREQRQEYELERIGSIQSENKKSEPQQPMGL